LIWQQDNAGSQGQTAQFTPLIAASIPIKDTAPARAGADRQDNFAPRIGFAYKVTNRAVLRGGYGIFYGGYETGPWSNPSPGFNPPFSLRKASTNRVAPRQRILVPDRRTVPFQGWQIFSMVFRQALLTDPNTPQLLQL